MLSTDIPARLPIPFANAAGGSYIRAVPTASQIGVVPGAASLTDGFVPLNFLSAPAGGIFPDGRDVNGILKAISAWVQWQAAGQPIGYDAAFSAAIGGYPQGALINAATGVAYWYSMADNNTTDPDTGGAGWQFVSHGSVYAGNPNGHVAGVAVSANGITQGLIWDTTDLALWACTTTGDATTAVWTAVTGAVSAIGVAHSHGFNGVSSGGATPTITLSTDVTGLVKGNGTSLLPAVPVVDYVSPGQFTGANQLLTTPGFQMIPGTMLNQWGLTAAVPTGSSGLAVTFPEAFPVACAGVFLQFTNAAAPGTGKDMGSNIILLSTTGFTVTQQSGVNSQYLWHAIGW